MSEEIAVEIAREISAQIKVEKVVEQVKVGERRKSDSIIIEDYTVSDFFRVFDIVGKGKVNELLLISTSVSFYITITIDGEYYLNRKSFTELSEVSEYSDVIDAYSYDTKRILRISDLYFNESCWIEIYADNVTFDNIHVFYEVIADD